MVSAAYAIHHHGMIPYNWPSDHIYVLVKHLTGHIPNEAPDRSHA